MWTSIKKNDPGLEDGIGTTVLRYFTSLCTVPMTSRTALAQYSKVIIDYPTDVSLIDQQS